MTMGANRLGAGEGKERALEAPRLIASRCRRRDPKPSAARGSCPRPGRTCRSWTMSAAHTTERGKLEGFDVVLRCVVDGCCV